MDSITIMALMHVGAAISSLSKRDRDVIEAALKSDLNLLRAAKKLRVSNSTYRDRFARALQKLNNALKHNPDVECYFETH